MAMALLHWLIVVTPGGYSLLKSEESAKAGLIQVKTLNLQVGCYKIYSPHYCAIFIFILVYLLFGVKFSDFQVFMRI